MRPQGPLNADGTWVLQQACRTFADWKRRFPASGLDCITVNVSSRQLMQQHFLLTVEQAVHEELIMANQPLGPRKVQPSVADNEVELYHSEPFEWPEHIAVRRVAGKHSTTSLVGQA